MKTKWNKHERKAKFMRECQELILKSRPDLAGKLPWGDLEYLFITGQSVEYAAKRVIERPNTSSRS